MKAIQLRDKYACRIKILVGFESEWIDSTASLRLVQDSLSKYPWEFFVGSVHHLHGIPIDWSRDLYLKAREISGGTDERMFEDYFDVHFEMLQSLKPPVVGHFDLIQLHCDKFTASAEGLRRWPGVWENVVRNLEYISNYGGLLELNSAALRKGLDMPYPSAEICQVRMIAFLESLIISTGLKCDRNSSPWVDDFAFLTTAMASIKLAPNTTRCWNLLSVRESSGYTFWSSPLKGRMRV